MRSNRGTERILIVDDTSSNLVLLNEMLCGAGYAVSVATCGLDALESARLALPDMVLLDILMPGMDGFEVLSSLKKDPVTQAIPVLLLSALGETESKTKGFELGASDYITKPFHLMEVLARMDTHLRVAALERRLRWSEGAMREGERIANLGTWTNDLESGKIEWSDELFNVLGSERSEGRSIAAVLEEVVFPEDLRSVRGLFSDPVSSLDGGKVLEFRLSVDRSNWRTIRATGKRIEESKTKGNRLFIGVLQDITRIRGDLEEQSSRHRFADLVLERHLDGILHLDREGKIFHANDSILHLVGKRKDALLGNSIDILGVPDSSADLPSDAIRRAVNSGSQRTMVKVAAWGKSKDVEFTLVTGDGAGASVVVFVRPLGDTEIVG